MIEIGAFEAKNKLSELLKMVKNQGEKIVITNRGEPVARLVPIETSKNIKESIKAIMKFGNEHELGLGEETLRSLIEEGRK